MGSKLMYEEDRSVVRTPVVKISKLVLPRVCEQVQPVGVGKEKDHLVRICGPSVPNRREGCDWGRGSMRLGDPLVLEHGWVVEEQEIEVPAMCVQQEQGIKMFSPRSRPKL